MLNLGPEDIFAAATGSTLLELLAQAFRSGVEAPPRMHCEVARDPPVTLLLMPAWGLDGLMGVKIVTVAPGNAALGLDTVMGQYLLMSATTGEVLATLDGRALTLLRTAAVSALAASMLAPAGAGHLLIVGTGALAPHLARGHAAVRSYTRISIWGRRRERAESVACQLADEGLPAVAVMDLRAACEQADVVSCATLSQEPLVHGDWLRPGTHVDLVGSFKPTMREADDTLIARGRVVVDSATALSESGDLSQPIERGVIAVDSVGLLSTALRDGCPPPVDLSVFKAVGTAIADLAVAARIVAACAKPKSST